MEIKRNRYLEQLKRKAGNGKTIRIDTEIDFIVNTPLGRIYIQTVENQVEADDIALD